MRDHGLQHLGGHDHRHLRGAGLADDFLLDVRHFLEGHVHPEIAARDHDGVDHGEDAGQVADDFLALELGHDGNIGADVVQEATDVADVGGRPDEGDGDEVDAVLDAEPQIFAILGGETARRLRHAGQRDPLVVADPAPDDHPAPDVDAVHLLDRELDHAIVHPDAVVDPDLAQVLGVRDRRALGGPRHRPRGQRELAAGNEIDAGAAALAERPQADLGALQILKDRDGAAPALAAVADAPDALRVLGVRAVREVQPGHVHAGGDETVELLGARGCRTDGADDLRATHTLPHERRGRAHLRNAGCRNCPV